MTCSTTPTALLDAAQARGYRLAWTQTDHVLDLRTTALAHPLPAGYRVVEDVDPVKLAQCVWYGFDHGDKGAFAGWEQDTPGDWTPRKAYLNVQKVNRAPHATPHLRVTIADDAGEYVCHAGMWWVPENGLAYLEPLCTVPAHRRRGLAAAALSILQTRMQALGATHLTGGGDPFYRRLGFAEQARWLHLRK